jgi:proteasome alpha subunit
VMGGTTEPITTALKDTYEENADLTDALRIAVDALRSPSGDNSASDQPKLDMLSLEVAILDVNRPRRAFRRITGSALEGLLPKAEESGSADAKSSG